MSRPTLSHRQARRTLPPSLLSTFPRCLINEGGREELCGVGAPQADGGEDGGRGGDGGDGLGEEEERGEAAARFIIYLFIYYDYYYYYFD